MKILSPLILLLSISLLQSCDKEEVKLDPKKTILGKWENTSYGNGKNLTDIYDPLVLIECFSDSILRYYDYEYKTFSYQKYWFQDSLLIHNFESFDDITNEIKVHKLPYTYEFISSNEFRLEFQFSAQWRTSYYKRID